MISPEDLFGGHTLSNSTQPHFADVISLLRDSTAPITLVLGAGISIDSGLPTWSGLIHDMVEQIGPKLEHVKSFVRADERSGLERRAEYVRQLVVDSTTKADLEVVRDALYPDLKEPVPGELANAIARLVAVDPPRFTILTTNFDGVLETALGRYFDEPVESIGLEQATERLRDDPLALACSESSGRVVHLHGRVAPNNQKNIPPVILTEAEFLQHGPAVRALITGRLRASATVFLGVSLDDTNLVGPLWDLATPAAGPAPPDDTVQGTGTEARHFVVKVLETVSVDEDPLALCRYELSKASYLQSRLGLSPIFVKSYSQQVQLISDLALAGGEPDRYKASGGSGPSTRYGARLTRLLATCYTQIGCSPRSDLPSLAAGVELSEQLHTALHGRHGPVHVLKSLEQQLAQNGLAPLPGTAEHFGLFLWLRHRKHGKVHAPYAVQLVGTSVYTHREAWSLHRSEAISPHSRFVAAKCLYTRRTEIADLTAKGEGTIWRGLLATPLTIHGAASGASIDGSEAETLDRVTIGSVTLNTTGFVTDGRSGTSATTADPSSILRYITTPGDLSLVAEALKNCVEKLLLPKR